MSRPFARGRLVPVAALTVVLAAACGAPPASVRSLEPADVPYALLSPSPQSEAMAEVLGPAVTTPSIYLLEEEGLVPVALTVDASSASDVADEVLADLADGPSEEQREMGLSSPLGPGPELALREIDGTTARVEVALSLRDPAADQLPLIAGQLVLSLTSIAGIEAVVLLRDGEPSEVPLPGGARSTAPVRALDYATLLAPGVVPPVPVPPSQPSERSQP